jgi:hypothetical protein
MKQSLIFLPNENPFSKKPATKKPLKANVGGSNDWYGSCSVQSFLPGTGGPLNETHADANGHMDYITQFAGKSANYMARDTSVQSWMYEEPYNNWQDTYGMDSVLAFYHSGHGGMEDSGVFKASLGGLWGGKSFAKSDAMNMGADQGRYIFWSTCFSLRVLGAHNPIRTWHPVNRGIRMLFGYETTSVDHGGYGKFLWEEWNKNKSFSQAFLDASWRISSHQAPSVMACGATAAEANTRLFDERFFNWSAASSAYYQWRWYYAAALNQAFKVNNLNVPKKLQIAEFKPFNATNSILELQKLATKLGVTKKAANAVGVTPEGNYVVEDKGVKFTVNAEGKIDATLAAINYKNTEAIKQKDALAIANKFIKANGLAKGVDVVLNDVRLGYTNGGTSAGSGTIGKERITDTTLVFKQTINGLPSVNADNGLIRITVDNDGTVTQASSSVKQIVNLSDKPKYVVNGPKGAQLATLVTGDAEKALDNALAAKLNTTEKLKTKIKDNSSIVGYDFNGTHATIVAQREYDVNLGNNIEKAQKIRTLIYG